LATFASASQAMKYASASTSGANGSDRGSTLTKRIELVLTKGGFNPVAVDVVGEESADRPASGLWPSDHAGVVATLQIPG
jgi:hypothetical protein